VSKVESRAEIFFMAFQSLSKAEREAVTERLLEDPELREDILDLALIQQRRGEPSRPFREYLTESEERLGKR
jgi:hypothetical protein